MLLAHQLGFAARHHMQQSQRGTIPKMSSPMAYYSTDRKDATMKKEFATFRLERKCGTQSKRRLTFARFTLISLPF